MARAARPGDALRIVSLVPSVTETLLAWGVRPAACTRFCEQPSLRHIGGTKDPELEAIIAMEPDLVVMDEEENRREDAAELEAAGVDVHVTAVRSLDDVRPCLKGLAERVGLDPADVVIPRIELRNRPADGLRVFVPIWKRPWMTISADTYGASLLDGLGALNVFADEPKRYPVVSLEDAVARGSHAVLAPSEPYPFGPRHVKELATVAPVALVDGQDLFWWGVRTSAALRRLGERLSSLRRA
jgi:ABC-type Fe3+-hydroxamate transport system substrate-binding protein